jgi:RNA polymerase sigma-70 factor (ECF subfamily)
MIKPGYGNGNGTATATDAERRRDVDLISRMADGDQAALAEFHDRYSATLYGVATKILNDQLEAETALQEGLVKLWHNAATYHDRKGSPFAWAVMIVRNAAVERLRERGTSAQVPSRNGTTLPEAREEPAVRELRSRAGTALSRLPKEHREILESVFFGGLTCEEAADQLDVPEEEVNRRLRRGLVLMRKLMSARHD